MKENESNSLSSSDGGVTIRAWWVNRLVAYLIPLSLFAVAFREFYRDNHDGATTIASWALVFLIALEVFFLGFRVVVDRDRLTYWARPRLMCAPRHIERGQIKGIEFAHFRKGERFGSANILVTFRNTEVRPLVLRLASFSPSDVRTVVAWLEGQLRRSKSV